MKSGVEAAKPVRGTYSATVAISMEVLMPNRLVVKSELKLLLGFL